MRVLSVLLLTCISFIACAQRIGNSPYPPVTATPDTLFYVHLGAMTSSQQLTVVTLQGLIAKTKPRIMVDRGTKIFQRDLALNYGVTYDSTYFNDFSGLISHFASDVSGYILCGLNDSTTNAAISLCSSRNAIAVTAGDTAVMSANNIPMLLSTVGKSQAWAFDSLGVVYNDRIVSFQDAGKCTYLSDYSVFSGAYHFSDDPVAPLSDRAFSHMQDNSALLGWGSEGDMTAAASAHNIQVHAADFANNLSTYTNFQVAAHQKYHSADTNIIPGKLTVCFLMTDGDNIQWLLGDFADNALWYGSPNKGVTSIGWTVSPALAELAPTVLQSLYDSARSATGTDYFVAGPSGMGYFYPDHTPNMDSAAAITSRMMGKADLSIVNVIGDVYRPQNLEPYFTQPNIDGMLYYSFGGGYTGMMGYATCFNGKPFIGAKYTLWHTYSSAPLLANALRTLPHDPSLGAGYILVSVHVWDHSVDSVISAVQLLDSNVRVVTPDAFIKLFKKGTGCRSANLGNNDVRTDAQYKLSNVPNPCTDKTEISFTLPSNNFISLKVFDPAGREVKVLYAGTQTAGDHHVSLDTRELSAGVYSYSLSGPEIGAIGRLEVVK